MRKIIKYSVAFLALLGVAVNGRQSEALVKAALRQSNGACTGGKGGTCPAGYKCNEFGFCIAGSSEPTPNGACTGGKGGTCPAGYKCNEFGFCIAGSYPEF
jgi:hypothetical protein